MQTKPVIADVDEPIIISEYDPMWPELFTEEERRVQTALTELVTRIEHFGSTAVLEWQASPLSTSSWVWQILPLSPLVFHTARPSVTSWPENGQQCGRSEPAPAVAEVLRANAFELDSFSELLSISMEPLK